MKRILSTLILIALIILSLCGRSNQYENINNQEDNEDKGEEYLLYI